MGVATKSNLEPRSVDPAEFTIGQPLPGALRDMYGRILIAAGAVLTQDILDRVARAIGTRYRVYLGPDWPPPPEPDAPGAPADPAPTAATQQKRILQSLIDSGLVADWSEKRAALRYTWTTALSIGIEEPEGLSISRREAEIQTVDVSLSGIGFTHDQFLHDGTIVYIQFDMLPRRPILKGIVRYCFVHKGLTHRVGVAFTPDE